MNGRARWGWRLVICWGLLIALYLAWPLTHLEAYKWTNDEGLHMQEAALMNAGYPLYTETAFNKPPLLIWILGVAFHIGGTTMASARLAALCLTLIGFVGVGMMARELWGKWGGIAAMAIVLALPELPLRAHVVMAGLPPMSLALFSTAAAITFQRRRRPGWILVSGAAFGSALLIHPMQLYWIVPLGAILLFPNSVLPGGRTLGRAKWWDILLFTAPIVGASLLVLAAVDRESFFAWVFGTNYQAATRAPVAENLTMLLEFLRSSWALIGAAAVGSVVLVVSPTSEPSDRSRALALLGIWWAATTAMLLVLTPLWRQYLIFLSFPLAVASAGGIVEGGKWVIKPRDGAEGHRNPATLWTRLLIIAMLVFGIDRWNKTRPYLLQGPEWSAELLAAKEFIEEIVPPDGFIATDDALLAFAAGRLVQPSFTEASKKQIELGNFTTEDAIDGMLRYGSQAALLGTGRLERLPGYELWIDEVASERHEFGEMRAYRLDLPRRAPDKTMARFENGIELQGYALSHSQLDAGDELTVMLYWRATQGVPADNHIFVHLVDETGRLWGQHDGRPNRGQQPTSQWQKGKLVYDTHDLPLSAEARPGRYRIAVGMYPWPDVERVPVFRPGGGRWKGDRVIVAEVEVAAERG